MAREHDLEIRFQAEEFFVENRMTHEEIARRLDIGLSTVKRWSTDGNWKKLREEHFERRRTLKQNLARLREKMIKQASDNLDPQDVYAVARLEKLMQEREVKSEENAPDTDRPKIFLENMEFVAEILKDVDPEGLKALARNFDVIVKRFKERYAETA